MKGLQFETQAPIVAADPNRADIACFVGFVARRTKSPLPSFIRAWMHDNGLTASRLGRPGFDPETLADVPVPIDSWELFHRLFLWERRTTERTEATYLGAAVRSFFSQGGRKCYVIRVGDSWSYGLSRAVRVARIDDLIPGGTAGQVTCTPLDRKSWSGVGHIYGLPDISYLCIPDLAEIFAVDPEPGVPPDLPRDPEQFVECGTEPADPVAGDPVRWASAPRCDAVAMREWASAINLLGNMLVRRQRELQLVAALPLPEAGTDVERDCHGWLSDATGGILDAGLAESVRPGVASAFVQLGFPWVRTAGSYALPEQLESPDGVLVGVLARNALSRGSFKSAAGLPLVEVSDVWPGWGVEQFDRPPTGSGVHGTRPRTMRERVSIIGQTPQGFALLSDVTTSLDEGYRPACVNRLVAALVRAARRTGEELVFEPSGEFLWGRIRQELQRLLTGLFQSGAFRGGTPTEAFTVRCDRSTMTQHDLDAGRVVVSMQFQAALPIERITVVLGLHEGGQVALLSSEGSEAVLS
ncbi:MAG: hypothetical protein OEY86_02435 [Nitrospira sp.]|nr:hypothetical protein [Nitrospira sp.]